MSLTKEDLEAIKEAISEPFNVLAEIMRNRLKETEKRYKEECEHYQIQLKISHKLNI